MIIQSYLVFFAIIACSDPESFVRMGSTLIIFFRTATKSGQLTACQQNAIEKVFRWQANNGPQLNADLAAL